MFKEKPTGFFLFEVETQNLLWKLSRNVATHDKTTIFDFSY